MGRERYRRFHESGVRKKEKYPLKDLKTRYEFKEGEGFSHDSNSN